MIAWSISAAQESSCFDQIIVSTDDDEIAEVARAFGAEVPFLRPSHLADDQATTCDWSCSGMVSAAGAGV